MARTSTADHQQNIISALEAAPQKMLSHNELVEVLELAGKATSIAYIFGLQQQKLIVAEVLVGGEAGTPTLHYSLPLAQGYKRSELPFTITYSIKDAKNAVSTTKVNVPRSVGLTNVTIFATEMAKLINNLTRGAITRIGAATFVPLPAILRQQPLPNSDVEQGARFRFRTEDGFYTALRLPTFDKNYILPGSKDVDTTDAAVVAFVTVMTTGINLATAGGTGTASPSDKRDNDVVALASAKKQFLSSRR
jgi:hypothetical protein